MSKKQKQAVVAVRFPNVIPCLSIQNTGKEAVCLQVSMPVPA